MSIQKLYRNNSSVNKKGQELLIKPKKNKSAADTDSKFMKMEDEFITEHKDVLQELSKR